MIQFDIKLIAVGLSVLVSIIIAFVVLFNKKSSATNRTFFAFTLATILWGIVNYVNSQYNFKNEQFALLFLRLNLFFGLWQSFFLFHFFKIFPKEKANNKWWGVFVIFPLVILTSVLIFTPYVFSGILSFSASGQVDKVTSGPGLILFGILATGLVVAGLIILFIKYLKYKGMEKTQTRLILNGSFFMFLFIITFNFIFPTFFGNSVYMSVAAVFAIPFLVLTGYSIIKYHLFNVKIITTELITFILWIFILIRALVANSLEERVINGGLFIIVIIVGISLIKSVRKEVEQREKLEVLTKQLEEANEKLKGLDKLKTEFLSLASHQLRSPLTAIKGYASMITEGDYGEINPKAKEMVDRILESSKNLAFVVEDLLNVTKIEAGGMQYVMAEFNFGQMVAEEAKELSVNAEKKGLKFTCEVNPDEKFIVNGDKEKLMQVILNLIDNSIKYTKEGSVDVSVVKNGNKIRFAVKDTGMGMTGETKETLFKKFARGEGGKMNASGTGLGLYLAKEIIEAHKGKVGVDSDGLGKGSTFWVELEAI